MVKINRTPTPPASLARKSGACYREDDVVTQLRNDFNDKCYLCERDEIQSPEVEHLQPHGGNPILKYQWENLFLSCAHCNSVKNVPKYNGMILDCCEDDPESLLDHALVNGIVTVHPLDPATTDPKVIMTAQLLTECFEKTSTGIRKAECEVLKKSLNRTMNTLYRKLGEYKDSQSQETLDLLEGMLSRTYKFAGFTRAYVRAHLDDYPALAPFVAL